MKSIDFTKPGGFPLTQDQLNYLQASYREALISLAKIGGSDGPFIISGIEVGNPTPDTYTVTEGWLFYNGELVYIGDEVLPGIASGYSPYVQINPSNTGLIYNDGSTQEVVLDNFGTLVALPTGTANDATHFLLSDLQRYGVGLGLANRESAWSELIVNTDPTVGGVTGTIYYKKNFITNTLHIRGLLSANNAQNFAASPGATYSLMGTLPGAYVPANNAYFSAYYFSSVLVKDDLGVSWIKHLNGGINPGGQVFLNWLRPDISIAGYAITINTIVPLD